MKKEIRSCELGRSYGKYMASIKTDCNIKLEKLRDVLAKKLEISSETIRKYEGGVPQCRAQRLMEACVELGMTYCEDIRVIYQFYIEFRSIYKKKFVGIIDVSMPLKKKLQRSKEKDNTNIKKIICPQSVKRKWSQFWNNENGKNNHFLYLCGTYKSGMTTSLKIFLEEMMSINNSFSTPLPLYDIEGMFIEDIRDNQNIMNSLLYGQLTILRTGFSQLPREVLQEDIPGKLIIIAHVPCKEKYIPGMEYMIFNDAVSQENTIKELIEGYIPELLNMFVSKEKNLGKLFIQKMGRITGGIPLAVSILGKDLYTKEVFKYETDLKEALERDFYLLPDLTATYETLWKEFMEETWNRISAGVKDSVIMASHFDNGLSLELFHFLVEKEYPDRDWREILDESYQYLLFMESGKTREEDNGSIQGIRIFPLTRELLRYKFCSKEDYQEAYNRSMKRAIEFYMEKVCHLDVEGLYRGEKCFFDRGGEFNLIKEILEYCYRQKLDKEYLFISGKLENFFYLREKYVEEIKKIYDMRSKVAERHCAYEELLETYGCIMNRAAKRDEKEKAKQTLKISEEFLKMHPVFSQKKLPLCHKYLHGKALVLLLVKQEADTAQQIWDDMLKADNLTERELFSTNRWKRKCMFKLRKFSLEQLEEEFIQGYTEAMEHQFYMAAVDYLLHLSRIELLHTVSISGNKYVYGEKSYLQEALKLLDEHPYIDNKYRCEALVLQCYVNAVKGKDYQSILDTAFTLYKRSDKRIWQSKIGEAALFLRDYGNIKEKSGNNTIENGYILELLTNYY